MRKFLLASVLTVASSMVASATVIIDDFTTTLQDGVCAPNNPSCGYASGGPTTFTGTNTLDNNGRTIQVTATNNPTSTGDNARAKLGPNATPAYAPGVLSFSSDEITTGTMWVTWTTDAPLDLITAGYLMMEFDIVKSDLGGQWKVTLFDATNSVTTGFNAFGAVADSHQSIGWGGFSGPASVLNGVEKIVFEYQGVQAADTSFDNFAFNTPEPSTWVLLGSALVGLAVYRRRK